ncbi:MAG TPA: D-alanine--D-alanine ligase [Bacteroidales bacterium]|nr:D-alanine--D-alanine ligase [Bacteroidales bacterium]
MLTSSKKIEKNIALIAGGDSGEYVISIKSARTIKNNIDPIKYKVYTILVSREKWVFLDDQGVEHPVDKNDFSISPFGEKILFDCAFITIHGTPGEDGKLQGYFELLGIPYTTSGLLPSALTFNKYFCNQMVASWGIPVARSVKIDELHENAVAYALKHVSLPVFVKPNKGGSSLGTTFVKDQEELGKAIDTAFEHDNEVLVEEYIPGRELTCGAFRKNGRAVPLPVTEIISKTEARFFDFQAKYTTGGADEITPAHISESLTAFIQETTKTVYEKLELKGMARIDYIYSDEILYFLEANITPGMTDASIVPQQAVKYGLTIKELFSIVIEEAISSGIK